MDAQITGTTDDLVGLSIIDNNDVEHVLDVRKEDGEITAHRQDGYPDDPSERTEGENVAVRQARRYAKYHVDRETEHDVLPWELDRERIEAAREALASLSTEAIEAHFGALLHQSLSHYTEDPVVDTGEVSRPVALPEDMGAPEETVMYYQELYLEDGEIAAVSGLIVSYVDETNEIQEVRHGSAPDRDPDARVEVSPVPIVAPEPFCEYLQYNLRCQLRDCYVAMGEEPPEEYRVLGPGQFELASEFDSYEPYEPYFDKHAEIPGYEYAFEPSSPVPTSELTDALAGGDADESPYERVRDVLFSRGG